MFEYTTYDKHNFMDMFYCLAGQPSKPQLTNHALADGGNSIMFEWTLESFAPISEYQLQFRNKLVNFDMHLALLSLLITVTDFRNVTNKINSIF